MPLPEQTGDAGLARRARALLAAVRPTRRPILAAMICVAALSARPADAQAADAAASLLIQDVTVVSAHLDRAQPNMDVLIAGDRILDVVAAQPGRAADRVIDGRGRFLIPGLIDSHVHLGHNPMIDPAGGEALAGLRADYRRQQPRSFLFHGVTSVVDLDYAPKRSGWPKNAAQTPHVYHCGRGVRVGGGYGPAFVPAPTSSPTACGTGTPPGTTPR